MKALVETKEFKDKYNIENLDLEYKMAFEMKAKFEENLINELNTFDKCHFETLGSCVNGIFDIIKSRNLTVCKNI